MLSDRWQVERALCAQVESARSLKNASAGHLLESGARVARNGVKTVGIRAQLESVCFDGLALGLAPRQLPRDGEVLHQAPRVVSKRELCEQLWKPTIVSDITLIALAKTLVIAECSLWDGDVTIAGATHLLHRTAAAVGTTKTVSPRARREPSRFGCR